jgi:hypothetical protein
MSMRTSLRPAALAAVVLLAGCQSLRSGGEPVPDDTPGTPADDLLLQIEVSGGFVPMGYAFSNVPQLTVYADGRAIVQGPQILIYPGPVLPNLQVGAADVDAIIGAAVDAGLIAKPPDYGQPPIADAPTTFVTITVDGKTYSHAANALDIVSGPVADLGLTEDQLGARNRLAAFVAEAQEHITEGEPYEITGFGLFAWPTPEAVGQGEIEAEVLPWPLALSLADATECTTVTGAEAATLLENLAGANELTQFEQDGTVYEVHFRPLLPHESGCDDLV